MTVKASTTDMCDLTTIQVQELVVTKHAFLRLPHRKCMGKSLIGYKCCAKHLNNKVLKYFYWVKEYYKRAKFQTICNCMLELLNVFEDSAQRVRTIARYVYSNRNDGATLCYVVHTLHLML